MWGETVEKVRKCGWDVSGVELMWILRRRSTHLLLLLSPFVRCTKAFAPTKPEMHLQTRQSPSPATPPGAALYLQSCVIGLSLWGKERQRWERGTEGGGGAGRDGTGAGHDHPFRWTGQMLGGIGGKEMRKTKEGQPPLFEGNAKGHPALNP